MKIDKNDFHRYLRERYPDSAENNIKRIKSDAFYIENNSNTGIDFKKILSGIIEPDSSIEEKLKKHLERIPRKTLVKMHMNILKI